MKRALFLDRDGTLNEMVYDETHGLLDSPRRPEQVRLISGVADFMKKARKLGYALVVVTNQPGIAKGTLTPKELALVNERLALDLTARGAVWDALYFCPHHPKGGPKGDKTCIRDCDCRKPKPGLLQQAAREHNIDLSQSWMVGDGLVDVQAGKAAGCSTVLVGKITPAHIERFLGPQGAVPDRIVPDLAEALKAIVSPIPPAAPHGRGGTDK